MPFRMRSWNGLTRDNPHQNVPPDLTVRPFEFRRYVDSSVYQVQLYNSLRNSIARGTRFPYRGAGWLYGMRTIIPGLQRDQFGGYPPSGMDPLGVERLFNMGPGSQPQAPGFPGMLMGEVDFPGSG